MDRAAVLVDAGYFFAAGSALVRGGSKCSRTQIALDVAATVAALKTLATAATGKQLLRIYWYDGASVRYGPTAEHFEIAHCNDVKLRLGFLNTLGQQKGVDSLIVTDLVELARNNAISDAVLMSGDEDVRIGVVLAQSFGVRVHLVAIHPGRGTQSRQLQQEADTCTEWMLNDVKPLMSIRAEVAAAAAAGSPAPVAAPAGARASVAASRPSSRQATAASAAPVKQSPEIDTVAAALVGPLKEEERQRLLQYLQVNRNNIPNEFDGKLLARCRTALSRDLEPSEKTYARTRFRTLLNTKP